MLVCFGITCLHFIMFYQHSRLCIHLETNRTFWVATTNGLASYPQAISSELGEGVKHEVRPCTAENFNRQTRSFAILCDH